MKHMVFGGRWIMIASMGGSDSRISLENIWRKRLKLIGSTLRSRTNAQKGEILRMLEEKVWPLISNGSLKVIIEKTFPVSEAESAHKVLRDQSNIGKVILTFPGRES